MKSDLSRSTFSAPKHYRDVRLQMGRVPLDADFNEYVDIVAHRQETETKDVIGRSGAPVHDAAFQLAATVGALPTAQQAAATALGALATGDFYLSAGRYYVDGILCENEQPLRFSDQAAQDFPAAAAITQSGLYLAYLDVWARHLTFLDDASLREVALGGPDTATRQKNLWQVRLLRVADSGTTADCDGFTTPFDQATQKPTGTLAAEVDPSAPLDKPCILPPGGGYRRLENQLYRVEIHASGAAGAGATFKWSRDNGAVVSGWAATTTADTLRLLNPPRDLTLGFTVGQWVEITDDVNDLNGTPGTLFEVAKWDGELLKLKSAPPAATFTRHPKVRRWDNVQTVPVVSGAWIALEDGVRVQFGSGSYRTGDYWMIPARTALADVLWPRVGGAAAFLPPQGITHHYARLGFVDFNGTAVTTTDCRPLFTPLTEQKEETCDLKLHNKHLHGKGVVCGLQVLCAGQVDRQFVAIQPGHAIDCEGTDLLLKQERIFDALGRAKELGLVTTEGNGEARLTLRADNTDAPVFDLEAVPSDPTSTFGLLKQLLEGTLWSDFFRDCLAPYVELVRKAFITPGGTDDIPVPEQKRNLITVLNLASHQGPEMSERRLWLSEEQHDRLATLYSELTALATGSATFCGLQDSFPSFPAYPFASAGDYESPTIGYAGRELSGLASSPDNNRAVAWGPDDPTTLFIFNTRRNELINSLVLPNANGLAIRHATYVASEGVELLVVAYGNAQRTLLITLSGNDPKVDGPAVVVEGRQLVQLVPHPLRLGEVLAVELGQGVHAFNAFGFDEQSFDNLTWSFNAAGHLAVAGTFAAATVATKGPVINGTYTGLTFARLSRDRDRPSDDVYPLSGFDQRLTEGQDGLAMALSAGAPYVHVAVNPIAAQSAKSILVVTPNVGFVDFLRDPVLLTLPVGDDGATGPVTLAGDPVEGRIYYGLRARNQILWTEADATALSTTLTLPTQANPIALAFGSAEAQNSEPFLLVANGTSATVSKISLLRPESQGKTDAEIEAYRDAVSDAFQGLVLPLLQSLKDCLCRHLLLDCPECKKGETLPLATLQFREGKVYHICNFSRAEVLTFPKVKYWLSAVPILPFITWAVQEFCCAIFVDQPKAPGTASAAAAATAATPGSSSAPAAAAAPTPVPAKGSSAQTLSLSGVLRSGTVKKAIQLVQSGELSTLLNAQGLRAKTYLAHLFTPAGTSLTPSMSASYAPQKSASPMITEVIDQDAMVASSDLTRKGVKVTLVEDYKTALDEKKLVSRYKVLPTRLEAGQKVRLYTTNGKVAYYEVDEAPSAPAAPAAPAVVAVESTAASIAAPIALDDEAKAEINQLRAQLGTLQAAQATRDQEMQQLRSFGETLLREISQRDQKLSALETANASLNQRLAQLAAQPAVATVDPAAFKVELNAALDTLRKELIATQKNTTEALKARDLQITELRGRIR